MSSHEHHNTAVFGLFKGAGIRLLKGRFWGLLRGDSLDRSIGRHIKASPCSRPDALEALCLLGWRRYRRLRHVHLQPFSLSGLEACWGRHLMAFFLYVLLNLPENIPMYVTNIKIIIFEINMNHHGNHRSLSKMLG